MRLAWMLAVLLMFAVFFSGCFKNTSWTKYYGIEPEIGTVMIELVNDHQTSSYARVYIVVDCSPAGLMSKHQLGVVRAGKTERFTMPSKRLPARRLYFYVRVYNTAGANAFEQGCTMDGVVPPRDRGGVISFRVPHDLRHVPTPHVMSF